MVLTTLQSTTGVAIAGGATVSTLSVGGYPIVKNGDDFIIDTKERNILTRVTSGVCRIINYFIF